MGKAALDGQRGIHDVVKAVRNKPFGEWNVVYYDEAKTEPKKILQRLRAKGCPKATCVASRTITAADTQLDVINPVVTPGDLLQLVLKGRSASKPSIGVPEGWNLVPGPSDVKQQITRIYVQTPGDAKPGAYKISLTAPASRGSGTSTATLSVDVVSQVK